jgi:hypothetical protein
MASPGEETGADWTWSRRDESNSIMAETDLERRVLKLHTISCEMRKKERMT